MKRHILAAVFLLLTALGVYSNSLTNGFMLDDRIFFDTTRSNAKFLWTNFIPDKSKVLGGVQAEDTCYRPLSSIIPMMSRMIFKENVIGYHAVNLLLLAAAAFAVYGLLWVLWRHFWLSLLTALFYTVHPMNGIIVNYVTAGVFAAQVVLMCAALYCVLRNYMAAACVLLVLSVFCHETAMALPLYAWAMLALREGFKRSWQRTWPLFAVLAVYVLFRSFFASFQRGILANFQYFHMNVFEYMASMGKLAVWYLGQLIAPTGVVIIYGIKVVRENVLSWCLVLAAIPAAGWLLMRRMRHAPPAVLSLAWLGIGFLPFTVACLFQPSRGPILEPHWFVFSSIGFFLLTAYAVQQVFLKARYKTAVLAGVIVLLVSWIYGSRWHNHVWADEKRYCFFWLKQSPEFSPVYLHLAEAYKRQKNFSEARKYFARGLTNQKPDILRYLNETGLMALNEGRWEEAQKTFTEILRLDPNSSTAYNNLGAVYYAKKDYPKAAANFQAALHLDRMFVLPRLNLAQMALNQLQFKQATSYYEDVLNIEPNNEIAMVGLVQLYMAGQDRANTLRISQRLMQASANPQYVNNTRMIFAMYGQTNLALQARQKLERLGYAQK